MVQAKITEADTPTIRLGASPSGLISNPPPTSPIFMPDALPAATLPFYLGLGQAPNMLACIPSGLVHTQWGTSGGETQGDPANPGTVGKQPLNWC